ncbi:MAG: peptide ABC transporter substrate-binding protein [Clostridium sp.]|uniref:peptide ABC transporter substrate-binding protein n=1 Tax=Clostridium sp. TaxID=1506 RepID=UPI003D6CD512
MKKLLCLMLIFMTMLASGCIQKKAVPSTAKKYLVYNLGSLPKDLLMIDSDDVRQKDLLLVLFEGLVKEDKDGEIVPAMAENIETSEDKIQYTFTLRKDLHYSDGTDINANDFKRLFYNILSKKDNAFAKQLYCIFGAEDFNAGQIDFENIGIFAKDDLTLVIRLNSPNEYFTKILCNPVFTLREESANMKNWQTSYGEIQYSGPYVIKDVNKHGEIDLVKNQKYWGASSIVSDEMLFTSIKDEEKALANFETMEQQNTSKIDVFVSPPISELTSLVAENKTEIIPSQSMYYLNFNLKNKKGLDKSDALDINFRNAIGAIIDRELIIETVSTDLAVPTINYTSGDSFDNTSSKLIFDTFLNKAKGLELKNISNYKKNRKLDLVYESENFDMKISNEIAKNIKEYLGVKVICTGYKKDELQKVIANGNYDMVFLKDDVEDGDIYSFFSKWTAYSKDNVYGYINSNYDQTIAEAMSENNDKNKVTIYKQAQEILAKDLPCIPIYIANTVICKKENIKGIYTTKSGNLVFDYAYKDNETTSK